MAGSIYEVIAGKRIGQRATAENKQDAEVLAAKKLRVFFYDGNKPRVKNGKHENGIISPKILKFIGFYG